MKKLRVTFAKPKVRKNNFKNWCGTEKNICSMKNN